MIQGWADEAERGYDVEQLRKRGRKPIADGPVTSGPDQDTTAEESVSGTTREGEAKDYMAVTQWSHSG